MTEPDHRKVTHFRVKPEVFQDAITFIRNVGHPPKGVTVGATSDLLNSLMRSEPVLGAVPIINPPPAGSIADDNPPANDPELANETQESS